LSLHQELDTIIEALEVCPAQRVCSDIPEQLLAQARQLREVDEETIQSALDALPHALASYEDKVDGMVHEPEVYDADDRSAARERLTALSTVLGLAR
jgi:hypothetical protein